LPEEWKESIFVPISKKGDKADYSNYRGISLLPTTYKILSCTLLSSLNPYAEEIIEDRQVDFDATRLLLIMYSAFVKYFRTKWEYNEAVLQLFLDFNKSYDSVTREALYTHNILMSFGTPNENGTANKNVSE